MFVSMNWISDYVDLRGYNIEELIHKFTLSTAEVEDIIYKGDKIKDVVVGEIISCEKHPDSKKLHLLKVDAGDRVYDCVCGAPNAAAGLKVAFVKAGGRVPEGEIKKCKVAGFDSEGMCCSEAELGISDDHSGIMILDSSLKNGTDIKSIFDIDDIIFEVDNKSLTNRPDLWGHYGIAREFAALTNQVIKPLPLTEPSYVGDRAISVNVKSRDVVYRYSCIEISDISKNVSPVNMRIRLYYCGMRGINLLADLTNYIMLELGQPMHAFDASKISGISVGTPENELVFRTLDGIERHIDKDTLLIYDNESPVAIAGIMGGLDSEIVDGTRAVVLESANFDAVSVRRSSTRLGLRTDASMRYEKTLDPELCIVAIKRFINLLSGIDGEARVSSKITDEYVKKYPPVNLSFDKAYVDRYTGIDISEEQILKTLTLLGFDVKLNNGMFNVGVPTWRATKDVTIKADLIEEITRIYGYDNFEIKTTCSSLTPVRMTVEKNDETLVKDILVQRYKMHEVHSYIWCDGLKYKRLGIDVEENVQILNMAAPENSNIRNSMLPTLLTFAYENRQFAPNFGIFEIGRVVKGIDEAGLCNERTHLGVVLFDKIKTEKELYFEAVEIIRYLADEIKHNTITFKKAEIQHNWQHPKNTSKIFCGDNEIGTICTLHPLNAARIDKSASLVCFEIDMRNFSSSKKIPLKFSEPSKFPGVDFDLSINTNGKPYSEIERAWLSINAEELKGVKLIDIYESSNVKSITVRLSFSSNERTLSMDEIQGYIDKVIKNLEVMGVSLKS